MFFGNDAAFWMHLQVAWDMHAALREAVAVKPRRRS
jgi:plasmid maintenance system antidote protein VapI